MGKPEVFVCKKSTVVYRLRKKDTQQYLVEHTTRLPDNRRSQPRLGVGSGELWETSDETVARTAREYFVPEDWNKATHERPINGYGAEALEIVRLETVEEVL